MLKINAEIEKVIPDGRPQDDIVTRMHLIREERGNVTGVAYCRIKVILVNQ